MHLSYEKITSLLGEEAESLFTHQCKKVTKDKIFKYSRKSSLVDSVFSQSDRNNRVLRSLESMFQHGRLKNEGYLSILPVDQGIEHSAGASFSPNPIYFNPENIIQLAMEGGCNAIATTLGGLGLFSRKYAHKIPFIVKINHNELLAYPNKYDQILFANVEQAYNMGALGIGATVYFGSPESARQIQEISEAFSIAHELGMFAVLWCYMRNSHFKSKDKDYHISADLTGQANHIGVTIQADIIKQKLPENNGGFLYMNKEYGSYGKYDKKMYEELATEHPIDLVRYQVLHCYNGRIGLINSGGASGKNDIQQAVRTAVINKRGGGIGLISGRKAFQKPLEEGIQILNAIQDVYLNKNIQLA